MERREPVISVIVPVYRVEDWLDRCVRSLTEQTFSDIEILLIDDGSPDGSPALCDAWAERDERVRVLHRANEGVSAARNAGIENAAGQYLAFVDSDDWLEPDALAYLHELLLRGEADFAMAGFVRSAGEETAPSAEPREELLSREEFLHILFKDGTQADVQYPWAKLYRRELFEGVRYPVHLVNAEDIPAAFAVALESRTIAVSTRVVYHYFTNPHGVTGQRFGKKNFDIIAAWDEVCALAEERGCDAEIVRLARLNRLRADFGVLCNLAMSPSYDEDRRTYAAEKEKMLFSLRQNRKELIRARMPLSRKLILTGFCASYPVTARLMNLGTRLTRARREET